jgi:pimeloyl-ACP methyl ester carboxylesterase
VRIQHATLKRGTKVDVFKVDKITLTIITAIYSLGAQFSVHAAEVAGSVQVEGNPDLSSVSRRSENTLSASLPSRCADPSVISWNLPVYWDRPNSPTFRYSFQIQLATVGNPATAPLLIMIPGGAGVPSIGLTPSGAIFPATFNVIYTDVRGVGCNANPDNPFTSDALTTDYFSRDVLSIVQILGLKNYILYGVSYGTVQATVMTHLAQNAGIQLPHALILEGVLGSWWLRAKDTSDYNKEWNKAKDLLPANVVNAFQDASPYGISSSDWLTLLTETLNEGATPERRGNSTVSYLLPLGTDATRPAALIAIQKKIAQIRASFAPETVRLATTLHCTETAGSIYQKMLMQGEIVSPGPNLCEQFALSFVHPYDSAQHPVQGVPTYYFEGSEDPDTSPENALYHYTNQTLTDRLFVLVWGAGHPALSKTLYQRGCTPAIYTAIATNSSDLGAALTQCQWPMSVGGRSVGAATQGF